MNKGLQGKRNSIINNSLKSLLLFVGLFVFGGFGNAQITTEVCGNGVLFGADLFDVPSAGIPSGHRSGGYWSSPQDLSFSDRFAGEDVIVSGFSSNPGDVYTVMWTRNNGTAYEFEITVNSAVAPTALLENENGDTEGVVLCSGDDHTFEVDVNPNGSYDYEFFEENYDTKEVTSVSGPTQNDNDYAFTSYGDGDIYEVFAVVTDNSGTCRSVSNPIQVSDISDVEVEVVGGASACQGDISGLELEVVPYSSDFTYEWYNSLGPIAGETGPVYSVDGPEEYYVVVEGCSPLISETSNFVTVGTYDLPTPTIDPSGTVYLCQDDTEIAFSSTISGGTTPTAGLMYEWLHNDDVAQSGTLTTFTNNTTLNPTILGEYQLILRENGNEECYNSSPVTDVPGRVAFEVLNFSTIGSPSCEASVEPVFNVELDATYGNPPYSVTIANTTASTTRPIGGLADGSNTVSWESDITKTSNFELTNVQDANGCQIDPALMPVGPITFTVNPINVYSVLGSDICSDGTTSTEIRLSDSDLGVDYYVLLDGAPHDGPISGSGNPLDLGNYSDPGQYTVVGRRTGCTDVTMTGDVMVSEIPDTSLPVTLTGTGCSGSSHTITVGSSEADVYYSLYRDGFEVRSPRLGNGGNLEFTGVTTAGNYEVFAERGVCSYFFGSVTINKTPDPQSIVDDEACEGENLLVELAGSEVNFDYILYDGPDGSGNLLETVQGDGNAIIFSVPINIGGTYSVIASNPGTSCTTDLGDVSIHDSPDLSYTLSTTSPTICENINHVFTLSGSEVGVRYRLYRDDLSGTPVDPSKIGDGGSIDFDPQFLAGTYLVTADNNGCEYPLPGAEITINERPEQYNVLNGNACVGDDVTIELDNSQTDVSYILYRNGSPYGTARNGTDGTPISFTSQYPEGTYTVVANNNGCLIDMIGSVDVNPLPDNLEIRLLDDNYCAGSGDETISGYPSTGNYSWEVQGATADWFDDNGDHTATFNVDDALAQSGERSYNIIYRYQDPNTLSEVVETTNFHDDINDNLTVQYHEDGTTDPMQDFPAGDLVMCQTDNPIELAAYFVDNGSLINDGSYSASGAGITDNADGTAIFDPATAGNGNHTITYTYTDGNGCTGSVDYTVQIGVDLQFTGLNLIYCEQEDPSNPYPVTISARPADGTLPEGGILNLYRDAVDPVNLITSDNETPIPTGVYPSLEFNPTSLGPDTYVFEYIYEHGGCENIITQEVLVPDVIEATFDTQSGNTQFCESQSSVTLVPDQAGGLFTGTAVSGNVFSPSSAGAGTHDVTYTINTGGCFDSYTITISVIEAPQIDIDGLVSTYCETDGAVIIEANTFGVVGGTSTFTSTGNAAGISPVTDNGDGTALFDPTSVGPGTYWVTLEYDHPTSGCSNTVTERVDVHATTFVNFADDQPGDQMEYCQNGGDVDFIASFSIVPTTVGNFSISGGTATSLTDNGDNTATLDPSVLSPGDYGVTFTFTNADGCTDSRTKTITVLPAPAKYTVQGGGTYCSSAATGPEVTLSGSQNNTDLEYELLLNGLSLSPRVTQSGDGTPITFGPQSADGVYTVIAINTATGCISEMTGSVDITKNEVALTVDDVINVSCAGAMGGTITATASGGSAPYLYSLYSDAGLLTLEADNNNGIFEFLDAGTYYLQVEDATGCELSSPVEVTITEPLNALTVDTDSSPVGCSGCTGTDCEGAAWIDINGGTAFADLSAYPSGYNIEWTDNGGATITPVGDGTRIEQQPAGFYTVTVTDAKGCTVSEVIEIETVDAITLTEVSRTNVDCFGSATGSFTVEAGGGDTNADYQFSLDQNNWFGPDAAGGDQRTFENLSAGTYNVYVRDANYPRCETQLGPPIVISQPDELTVNELPGSHVDVNCYGDDTGAFEVEADGGIGAYSFSLNGGTYAAGDLFENLVAGSYSVTVQDAEGCMASLTTPVEITHSQDLAISDYDATNVSCNLGNDGTITITAQGGDGNYVYSLTDGTDTWAPQASATFGGLEAGSYDATVTDGNSCAYFNIQCRSECVVPWNQHW
jgi:hypothetical protein